MSIAAARQKIVTYLPIHLESLRLDAFLEFDLYVLLNNQMVLYRSAELPFTETTRAKLIENGVRRLYISSEAREKFQSYMELALPELLSSPEISPVSKATLLYDTSASLLQETLANPAFGDNIRRCQRMVENTMSYLITGKAAFRNLLLITNYDYTMYTHSVNVCAYSLALARSAGLSDTNFLYELGVGALLHDIGKARVSERILKKRGELSPKEFEIVKQHPRVGVEILRASGDVPEDSLRPVRQHHERGGRLGYPDQLDLHEMHIYSRIVAIADAFDAMTTTRVYQGAMPAFDALTIMRQPDCGYDPDLLTNFIHLLGPESSAL